MLIAIIYWAFEKHFQSENEEVLKAGFDSEIKNTKFDDQDNKRGRLDNNIKTSLKFGIINDEDNVSFDW